MIARREKELPFYQFESIPNAGRLQHAMFTRQGGVSSSPFSSLNLSVSVADKTTRVYANRSRAYSLFERDTDSIVHAHLVHGSDVASVTSSDYGTWMPHVDGIITNERGCALTMNYADCTPIFLYDPHIHAIGLGHAGWLGTVRDLPGSLVRAMSDAFGSDPANIIAGIGPCIGPCCYEVGEPVISEVLSAFKNGESLLLDSPQDQAQSSNGKPHFDLPQANRLNLERAGVKRIEFSGLCTACRTDLFFSHRAEKGKTGRFGAILILES